MCIYMQLAGVILETRQNLESANHPMLLIAIVLLLFKIENKKELHEEVNKFQWSALRCYLNDNIPSLM